MARENDLGKDRIAGLVWRIALPSMLAQFVSVLYSIVDRMYVGHIAEVGEASLAGVGVCGPVVTMIGSVAFLVGVGGAPMMSIQLGAGRKDQAGRIVANAFFLLCLFAVILTGAAIAFREPMLKLFGASGAIYPYAERYFTVYLCGTIFALLSSGMNQFVISQGFAVAGMKSVILGALCNILLDPVFIFGLGMGVAGAALATVISQAAGAAYVLWFLRSGKPEVGLTFGGYAPRLMGRILLMGLAPFSIIALDNVMIITMNALLKLFGGARADLLITANAIVQSFMLVVTMPLGGISGGTQGILSYNFGAGRMDRVKEAQKYICLMCVGFTAVMFAAARLCGPLFVALFTEEAEVARMALQAIRICTLAVIPLGVQYAIVDGFTAMGLVRLSVPLSSWRKFSYFAAIFVLPVLFGADAIFYAEPVSDVLGPLVSVTVYLLAVKKLTARAGLTDAAEGKTE